MPKFYVAVSTRCTEWHAVEAESPAAALAAYHDDRTTLDDDEVVAIDAIRVLDRETFADLTDAAHAPVMQ